MRKQKQENRGWLFQLHFQNIPKKSGESQKHQVSERQEGIEKNEDSYSVLRGVVLTQHHVLLYGNV